MAENIALTEGVYYILLALETPLHGYGIMQKTEEMSGGRVRLAVVPSLGLHVAPLAIARFRARHPDVSFDV